MVRQGVPCQWVAAPLMKGGEVQSAKGGRSEAAEQSVWQEGSACAYWASCVELLRFHSPSRPPASYAEKTAAEFKAACEDGGARVKAGDVGGADEDEDEDEDEDGALDDALDAMLDAQRRSKANLYDDFDEMEGS